MNPLSRLIQVLPNAVFGADKNKIIVGTPYVMLIEDCDPTIPHYQDFRLGGKIKWCKHRLDAISETQTVDIDKLFNTANGWKNFKLAFFESQVDIKEDDIQLLYKAKLVVRMHDYFDKNLVKATVHRNALTLNNLSEHMIYMDSAQP